MNNFKKFNEEEENAPDPPKSIEKNILKQLSAARGIGSAVDLTFPKMLRTIMRIFGANDEKWDSEKQQLPPSSIPDDERNNGR
ncbi:MAG: hypothetical protein KA974_04510 [Saprospiraceae bacterium]|nr:hypothetical protein [Saprospiraceae bacterium]MBP7699756.1 hypothetical protein [Saprospiraceae bacterium]